MPLVVLSQVNEMRILQFIPQALERGSLARAYTFSQAGKNTPASGIRMSIKWLESYRIGDAEIDAQHRGLFAAVNQCMNAKDRDSKLLCSLAMFRLAREHFEFEENLMRRVKYPAIADHFKEHTDLISTLTTFSERISSDSLQSVELASFLHYWLVNHMATSVAKLASHLWSLVEGKAKLCMTK